MDLTALTALAGQVPAFVLVLARVSALFVSAPVLGGPYAPVQAKILLAVAVSLILAPLAMPKLGALPMDGWYIALVAKEVMVGLSIGFVMDLLFHGVRMGGELINRHAGFSAAENFDPDSNIGAGPFGDLFYMAMVLLFLATDGHHLILAALARSYDAVPVGTWAMTPAFTGVIVRGVQELCVVSLALSFPVLATVMALTVAEGVITRAIPQINLLQLSFAVKILVSLLVIYAGLPAAVAFIGTVLAAVHQLTYATLPTMAG